MEKKRYLIEIGTGVDMHGGNMTTASVKAIKNAMSHCCMAGIHDVLEADIKDGALRIKVSCPKPEELDFQALKEPVNFYEDVEIVTEKGGCSEKGLHVAQMGAGDNLIVAVAVITVYVKLPPQANM
jgi:conserved hypothetical protein